MKYLYKFIGVYIAYLFQMLLIQNIKIHNCSPDIILPVLVIYSVSAPLSFSVVAGGIIGVISDALSASVFGINTLVYMYFALLVNLFTDSKTENSPLLMGFISFSTISATQIIISVVKSIMVAPIPLHYLITKILVKGVFGGIITLLIVLISQWVKKRRTDKTRNEKEEME